MASKKISEFPLKETTIADADSLPILDSEAANANKRTTKANLLDGVALTADLGTAAAEDVGAFDAAGTGASEAASAVSAHAGTNDHSRIPDVNEFAAIDSANSNNPSGANPFATILDLEASNVPTGGTLGQVLTKQSATDYDSAWEDPTGSGASAFTDLTDTPADYSGQAGKLVKVNPTADGLIFGDPSGSSVSWGDITGTIGDQTDLTPANIGAEPADATIIKEADVDDTPVDGATAAPVSSNWAFDHVAAADPHTGYRQESVDIAIADIDLDGGTDIGADLADADLILVDDGAAGTNRKSALSRVWTYISGKIPTISTGDITTGTATTEGTITAAKLKLAAEAHALTAANKTTTLSNIGSAVLDQKVSNYTAVNGQTLACTAVAGGWAIIYITGATGATLSANAAIEFLGGSDENDLSPADGVVHELLLRSDGTTVFASVSVPTA